MRHLNVLITGGSSGIGAMIAAAFVENGAHVLICSRKDGSAYAEELCSRARRVASSPNAGTCRSLEGVDVTEAEDLFKLREWVKTEISKRKTESDSWNPGPKGFKHVRRNSGMLDVLVNNSGTNYAAPLEQYDIQMFSKVMALNVTAQFAVLKTLLPLMTMTAEPNENISNEPAKVINITSINGERAPGLETYAYSASKAALRHLTQHLAGRLASPNLSKTSTRKICVNAIAPGSFRSRMMRGLIAAVGEDVVHDNAALSRMGEAPDIAGAILMLGSRAGDWITGTVVVVDGGTLVKTELSRL